MLETTYIYLGQRGFATAFKSFVEPVCEYGGVIFMRASAIYLHRLQLDLVQKAVERVHQVIVILPEG